MTGTGSGHVHPTLPREIIPGLHWFSSCLVVNEGPKTLHNHNACYLLSGDDANVLVDTAMPYGWEQLEGELERALDGRPLDFAFPTHPEAPHMGNLGPLMRKYPGMKVVGDLRNYHLYFPGEEARMRAFGPGDRLDLGGRTLVFMPAIIHDLPNTLWGYCPEDKVLFVSDAYPYTHEHEAHQCALTSEELPETPEAPDTMVVIGRALSWVNHVDVEPLIAELESFLAGHPVRYIAPAHGGFVTNPETITEIFKAGMRGFGGN